MCDKCELELALHGETASGFRCGDVTPNLLNERHEGIPRFAARTAPRAKEAEARKQPDRGGED